MSGASPSNSQPGDLLSGRERAVYIVILGTLTALGPFTIDMYLPAFPSIETQYNVDAAQVQLTLTGTMVGFALGQLIVGPLSDRLGRKNPLVIAAIVHIGASIGAAVAPTLSALSGLR